MRRSGTEYAGALSLLGLGAALGPSGLTVLTPRLLGLIDPAVPLALAALGVLAGLEPDPFGRTGRKAVAVLAVYDLVVAAVLAGGTLLLARALHVDAGETWMLAGVTGACALAMRSSSPVIPILLGGILLAWTREGAQPAVWGVLQAAIVAGACALAGWLLLDRASSETEPRVVTLAMLLLIGGAADYLSTSALLAGLVAGLCWRMAGGAADESMQRDVSYLRHPLLAVLLMTAGARTEFTAVPLALGLAFAALGAAVWHIGVARTSTIARGSNILGVALALNALRATGPEMQLTLAVVVIGAMASQLMVMATGRAEGDE